jgi:hypothetical protein
VRSHVFKTSRYDFSLLNRFRLALSSCSPSGISDEQNEQNSRILGVGSMKGKRRRWGRRQGGRYVALAGMCELISTPVVKTINKSIPDEQGKTFKSYMGCSWGTELLLPCHITNTQTKLRLKIFFCTSAPLPQSCVHGCYLNTSLFLYIFTY